MKRASREGRECRRGRGESGESPQLNVESVGEGERGGNRDPPGLGGMLKGGGCGCDSRSGQSMLLWRAKASMRRDDVAVHVVVPDQEAMAITDYLYSIHFLLSSSLCVSP